MKIPAFHACLLAALLTGSALARSDASCLHNRDIDGFMDAKRSSVVLTAGSLHWLAELGAGCVDLDEAQDVGTYARTDCVEQGDKLVYRDRNDMPRWCLITKLTYLPKDAK